MPDWSHIITWWLIYNLYRVESVYFLDLLHECISMSSAESVAALAYSCLLEPTKLVIRIGLIQPY